MARKDGGPAFATDPSPKAWEGMSLRDWFAGQALAGLMAYTPYSPYDAASLAYLQADAMLKERRRGSGQSNAV